MATIVFFFVVFALMIVAAVLCALAFPVAVVLLILLGSFGILSTLFWVWMIIDCIRNDRLGSTEKIVWAVVIACTHFIGALIYFFFGKLRTSAFPSTRTA